MATALDRCLRKEPDQRFAGGEALADALLPDLEIERELPVPLRVFIKQSREFETTVSHTLLGLSLLVPLLLAVIFSGAPGGVTIAVAVPTAILLGVPVASLLRMARRLLRSGFTHADGTAALLRDVEKKEEEYRFQVGERVTGMDRFVRGVKLGGFGAAAASFVMGAATGVLPFFIASSWAFLAGLSGSLFQEIRARVRGDVMGERLLRFWKGGTGTGLFQLEGTNLKRTAPAVAGVHRPTEVVIGLEADRLFEELPKETRRTLAGLPENGEGARRRCPGDAAAGGRVGRGPGRAR